MSNPVVVFGATGFTGRLVVESLLSLGISDIVLGGRSEEKLAKLGAECGIAKYRVADATRPETLPPLVSGAHVVIATAGPFIELGEPVVKAALEAGAHLLDTTGEQAYMLNVLKRFHGTAMAKQLVVVNGQAFEFAIGYCVSALLAASDSSVTTIDVFNRVRGFGATRGTRKSAIGALAHEALVRRGGRLVPRGGSARSMKVEIPGMDRVELAAPFPGGEALHLTRAHPQVQNVTTNLVAPRGLARLMTALFAVQPAYRKLHALGAFAPLIRRIDAGAEGPSVAERASQAFRVLARGRSGGEQPWVMATGADPYGITGVIAARGAKMLCDAAPRAVGVVSTDQAFGAHEFLKALEPSGVAVEASPGLDISGGAKPVG